jgi:anti-sigma factor RsiW
VTCDPERVTGFVDDVLPADERAQIEAHLSGCGPCREQADFEAALRAKLRALAPLEMPAGLARSVQRRLRPVPAARWAAAVLLPMAAAVVAFVLWLRAAPPFVAWQLARDHTKCFHSETLPAEVWGNDPTQIAAWFDDDGVRIPVVPESAGSTELVGARYCPLVDRTVAHLYYSGEDLNLSLFVLPGSVRMGSSHKGQHMGQTVHLLRVGGTIVGVVSSSEQAVEAVERGLTRTVAEARSFAPMRRAPVAGR